MTRHGLPAVIVYPAETTSLRAALRSAGSLAQTCGGGGRCRRPDFAGSQLDELQQQVLEGLLDSMRW